MNAASVKTLTILPSRRWEFVRGTVPDCKRRGARWISGWVMSDDLMDRLGGERSVWYWLRAECRRGAADATRLTRLWWEMRAEAPALALPSDDMYALIPAGRHYDVRAAEWLFDALAVATWCPICLSTPSWSMRPGDLCAWCDAAENPTRKLL